MTKCPYCCTEKLRFFREGDDYGSGPIEYDTWLCEGCSINWIDGHFPGDVSDCDEDDTPIGDDGYPVDMDDETKAWLSTNR